MPNQYDKILKEIIDEVIDTLISRVIGLKVVKSERLEAKLQITNEREADYVLKVTTEDGVVLVLHIEFQSTNYAKMARRELGYWLFLLDIYELPIMQYVFYIGNQPLTMKDHLSYPTTTHTYNLINMQDVDCETFLHSGKPEEIVIAILCDYTKKGVKIFIHDILQRIKDLVPDETLRGKYIRQVEVLSQLRNLQNEVCKEAEDMALVWDIEKDVRFRQGLEKGLEEGREKGREEGLQKGLLEGIELAVTIKFGTEGLVVMDRIRNITDINKLVEIKDIILKSEGIHEILGIIGSAHN